MVKILALSFIAAKCKVVHFGSAPYVDNYCLNETQLELLENIWDLGVQVDSRLKFHTHTNTVAKKSLLFFLGLISKSFECKDLDVIVRLYTTLVRPIIEYTYILGNQKLERIQHKAHRMIPSINHLSYHNRLRYLNLPSLQYGVIQFICINFWRALMIFIINSLPHLI